MVPCKRLSVQTSAQAYRLQGRLLQLHSTSVGASSSRDNGDYSLTESRRNGASHTNTHPCIVGGGMPATRQFNEAPQVAAIPTLTRATNCRGLPCKRLSLLTPAQSISPARQAPTKACEIFRSLPCRRTASPQKQKRRETRRLYHTQPALTDQPTHTRALRNIRNQGPSSPQALGAQELVTLR